MMINVQWHWVKDNNFPEDGQEVWCVSKANKFVSQDSFFYSKDLFSVDNWSFASYRNKNHSGFYTCDSEYGYYENTDVICWCEMPTLPEELKNNL